MLTIDHLSASYGNLQILHDIHLTVQPGERVGIFGHNGAGKTSLLKCCVGELKPLLGSVHWMGELVNASRLDDVFELFPILKERQEQRAQSLSGGQQQMLALGMSLMGRPQILLLDEPTTGLAPIIVKEMLQAIHQSSLSHGTSVLIVEQNVQATLAHVDRAIVMKQGRVIFDDDAKKLREQQSLWHLF